MSDVHLTSADPPGIERFLRFLAGPASACARLVVVGDGEVVSFVEVDLGFALEGRVQVRGPIAAGQRVVVRGNEQYLMPGQQVQVLP